MFFPDLSKVESLGDVAEATLQTLENPMAVGGSEFTMRACIGGAEFPLSDVEAKDRIDPAAELLKRAGVALRAAKQAGPGAYRAYEVGADDRVRDRVSLLHSLQRAIDDDQFEVHYQPVVNLESGRILGAEALVRWKHPTLGMQRPDQFIPLAEESGFIVPLGAWVMTEAMTYGRGWVGEVSAPPEFPSTFQAFNSKRGTSSRP